MEKDNVKEGLTDVVQAVRVFLFVVSNTILMFGMQLRCDKVLTWARDQGKAFDEGIKIQVDKSKKYQTSAKKNNNAK